MDLSHPSSTTKPEAQTLVVTTEVLQTEQYLVENPEHAEYLRKANRRGFSLLNIRRAATRWGLVALLGIVSVGFVANLGAITGRAEYDGIHLGRAFQSLFSEMNQEKKIWDTVDSM